MQLRHQNASILLLLLLLCLSTAGSLFAQGKASPLTEDSVTLFEDDQPLSVIIAHIRKQTYLLISINTNKVDVGKRYTLALKNVSVDSILATILGRKDFTWRLSDNVVIVSKAKPKETPPLLKKAPPKDSLKKLITLKGNVTDIRNGAIMNATVKIEGHKIGCITDPLGTFVLETDVKNPVLIISCIGFKTVRVSASSDKTFHIKLPDSGSTLDEKLVIGYGITSKRFSTGSIGVVSGKEIERYPVTNPLIALQGRVPGLIVTRNNGVNGSSVNARLIGQSSLFNSSDPLFIIDGVPFAANNKKINNFNSIAAQNVNGGISPFTSINPYDIESVEVLKDADATAIYGSRGANGVILITTKKGKIGKLKLSVDFTRGISNITTMPHLLNTRQYLDMRYEALKNDSIILNNVTASDKSFMDLRDWDTTRYTNFPKLLMGGQANYTSANISVTQGDENTQLLFGAGVVKQTTVFPTDMHYLRGSFNSSINHKTLDGKFQVSLFCNYSLDENQLFNGSLNAMALPPNTPEITDINKQPIWFGKELGFQNPMTDFLKRYYIAKENQIFNFNTSYKILRNLIVKSSIGYNSMRVKENSMNPIASQNPLLSDTIHGSASFGTNDYRSIIVEPQAEYSFPLAGGKVVIMAGGSWQYTYLLNSEIVAGGYNNDALLGSVEAAPYLTTKKVDRIQYKYAAFFGRITYNLKEKYIFNLSGRRDANSRFSPENRFNTLGAIGAAWIFSEESRIKDLLPFISYGKLRGSFGVTGNDQIGDYRYLDTWSSSQLLPYGNRPAMKADGLYNKSYRSERSLKFISGIDVHLFQGQVQGSAAYFRNRNDNQLVNLRIPSQTGFNSRLSNYKAVIENRGWEFELNADLIRNPALKLKAGFVLTVPKNKLRRYDQLSVSDSEGNLVVGESVNVLNRLVYDGINRQNGSYILRDINKDSMYSLADFRVFGNLDPKYFGGIHFSFEFKGLSLEVMSEFRKQIVPNYLNTIYINNLLPGMMSNQSILLLNRWRKLGDKADYARASTEIDGNPYANKSDVLASSGVYSKMTFFKIRNVEISYNLPQSWISGIHFENIRIYVKGQDLFTITNYKGGDPEPANFFSVPIPRTITCGLQCSF